MIISSLNGGLGNQMFQYAAARRLAEKHSTPLKLDINWFETQALRHYRLRYFNIWENLATSNEILNLVNNTTFYEKLFTPIRSKFGFTQSLDGFRRNEGTFKEKYFHFDPKFMDAPNNIYVEGFWQSEKYFLEIASTIRQEFTLKYPQSLIFHQILELISNTCSISIHIRRGDYVNNSEANLFHGVCSLDYYRYAVKYISEHVKDPHFFVFSDDFDWFNENLNINAPMNLVSKNKSLRDYEELNLMSQCKHHIIANSSFSWWGAWLNSKVDKIVVAPKEWFRDTAKDTEDLIPSTWIRL